MPQIIAGLAQRPLDGPLARRVVARDGVIERQREARLRQIGRALDQQVELPPALGFAFALALEQAQPLGGEDEPGMLGIDAKFLVLRQERSGPASNRRKRATTKPANANP